MNQIVFQLSKSAVRYNLLLLFCDNSPFASVHSNDLSVNSILSTAIQVAVVVTSGVYPGAHDTVTASPTFTVSTVSTAIENVNLGSLEHPEITL